MLTKPTSLTLQYSDISPNTLPDDRAVELIERHAGLERVQALRHFRPLAHMPAGLQVFLARRVEGVGRVDVDVGIVLVTTGSPSSGPCAHGSG